MPLEPLERLDRVQDPLAALDELPGADESEIVRGARRQQAHADVGRRSAVRDDLAAIGALAVVRRQAVILLAHEDVEIPP